MKGGRAALESDGEYLVRGTVAGVMRVKRGKMSWIFRSFWVGFVILIVLWLQRDVFAEDPCMDRLTQDHAEQLCLNFSEMRSPEVCRDNPQPMPAKPAIDLVRVLAPFPAPGSEAGQRDLRLVLDAQRLGTQAESECARADICISIFRFAGVMGPGFNPDRLPRTIAFFNRAFPIVDEDVAYTKQHFKRVRPFMADSRVQKIVPQCPDPSYPSGHSAFAYSVATLLTDMVPERAPEILRRADQYAYNRVLAGVHYPSDVAAGKVSASVIDYRLMHDAEFEWFQKDYGPACLEVRHALGLTETSEVIRNEVLGNTPCSLPVR